VMCVPELVEVRAHGSSTAFPALASGEANIGMSSRPIRREELEKFAALGDLTKPDAEHVLALDGLAVIVHPSNPLRALDSEKLARIFAGEITDWSTLGGNRGRITIYARDKKSDAYDTFRSLMLKWQDRSVSPEARHFESNAKLSDGVASDPNGIGFVGLTHIRKAKALAIEECGTSYRPNAFTVKTGDYPLVQRLFLYTPADSQSSGAVKEFVTFVVSDEGQKVVRESGFVGLDITSGVEEDFAAMQLSRIRMAVRNTRSFKTLKKFVETTEGATRLSVTFRFRKNSARLNDQALRDIQRLIAYMNGPKGIGKQLMLLGFSADDGDFNRNFKLSWGRAQTVADELVRHGVDIAVIRGFGNDSSVACSERRRNTNRRVEVWVK